MFKEFGTRLLIILGLIFIALFRCCASILKRS